ncbi:MAG: FAD-binding oxidoreductase [Candidatus Eisenbacteria bacterium]
MDLTATLGLDAARSLDPVRFRVAGHAPRAALRPLDRDELAEALRGATRERVAVVPWGAGVGLARMPAPARYDLALDLTGLDHVVAYEPDDFTLTAECGVTLAALTAAVAARGQELPLEGAHAGRATFGGVLAANTSGPRRLRFGSPRDRILGGRFVLGDGTPARTGGRVVKNVAGYAIHRLLCGSRGALAAIVEATIKLAPAPHARLALAWGLDAVALADATRFASLPRLEPAWWSVLGREAARGVAGLPDAPFVMLAGLEDDPEWVATQRARFVDALGAPHASVADTDALVWSRAVTDRDAHDAGVSMRFVSAHVSPASLAALAREPEAGSLRFIVTGGGLGVEVTPGRAAAFVDLAHEAGFRLTDVEGLDSFVPPIPGQSGVAALRARIRAALDPSATFAYGERWIG